MDQFSYLLPHSPATRRLDRFSVIDDDQEGEDGLVPFWKIVEHLLQGRIESSSQLIELLDTISNVARGSSATAGDYGTLKGMVDRHSPGFFADTWPKIAYHSLQLPHCFPEGKLPVLQSGLKMHLSRSQVASLVAHQFLCTLDDPVGREDYFDFSIWYSSAQRHPYAVEMYLEALFKYFREMDIPSEADAASASASGDVVYSVHECHLTSPLPLEMERTRLVPMSIQIVEKYDTRSLEPEIQGPSGAVVVSANKNIGFGQSATQEEVFVGNCPEACPAVLVTPTLQPDQTLTIEGAIPMLRIIGQRRSVSWQTLTHDCGAGGRLLFMDALEIDELDDMNGLPDLQPENIQREIRKAYTAFSSWESEGEANVFAGLWGCGAFNGDPGVKVAVMWIAGSIAGRKLNVICDDVHDPFLVDLKQLLDQVPDSWTVQDLNQLLQRIPRHTKRLETVNAMLRLLS